MELSLVIYCCYVEGEMSSSGTGECMHDVSIIDWSWRDGRVEVLISGKDLCIELMVLVSTFDSSADPPPTSGHRYNHKECVGTHFSIWKGVSVPVTVFNSRWVVFSTGGFGIVQTRKLKLRQWSVL